MKGVGDHKIGHFGGTTEVAILEMHPMKSLNFGRVVECGIFVSMHRTLILRKLFCVAVIFRKLL